MNVFKRIKKSLKKEIFLCLATHRYVMNKRKLIYNILPLSSFYLRLY